MKEGGALITVKKGDRISEYILEEPLGRGGFGEVWRARHHLWQDRQVAVKIPLQPEAVRDLSNEGLIQSTLDHPGIAKSLGMDTDHDPPYFIVELIEGHSLRTVLRERGKLPPDEVRPILEQILSVLEYAHGRGVIHQDIKPENILLAEDGTVKLTDFGLGQTVHGESILLSVSLRTEGPGPGGTIGYIAPEIRDHDGAPDGRADLYSVGILVFELLTGRRPAGGELPSELEPGLPAWCDAVFRGLYTRRETRFADVATVRHALEDAPTGPRVSPLVPPSGDLVPGDEATRILGVSTERLRELVGAGHLRPVSVNGTLHYDRASLLAAQRSLGLGEGRPASPPPIPGSARGGNATEDGSYGRKVEAPRKSKSVRTPPPAAKAVPAGLFVRSIAAGIDVWLVAILSAVITGIGLRLWSNLALQIVAWFLIYSWISHGVTGRTLGKLLLGLRVTKTGGAPISSAQSFLRTVGYLASFATLGFGFWMIPFNPRKQGLHDYIADTTVVYDRGCSKRSASHHPSNDA